MESVLTNPSVERVAFTLKKLGLTSEITILKESARSAAEAASALGIEVGQVASSIVFRLPDNQPLLVITSGRHRVDTHLVATQLES
ncbi:MAG: YbaK/EbsC family protein [Actinomycetota bacterium]